MKVHFHDTGARHAARQSAKTVPGYRGRRLADCLVSGGSIGQRGAETPYGYSVANEIKA